MGGRISFPCIVEGLGGVYLDKTRRIYDQDRIPIVTIDLIYHF